MATRPDLTLAEANATAWQIGRALLERAIRERLGFAFETTLGGNTGQPPPPRLVLHLEAGRILGPKDLSQTPDWARPIVAAALQQELHAP